MRKNERTDINRAVTSYLTERFRKEIDRSPFRKVLESKTSAPLLVGDTDIALSLPIAGRPQGALNVFDACAQAGDVVLLTPQISLTIA